MHTAEDVHMISEQNAIGIASYIGVSRDSINDRLEGALKKAKKYF